MARPIVGAAWLTRSTLNSIQQKSLLIEIDQEFLAQIQRILPASLAGFCVWTGQHNQAVWVKWHWYFDEKLKQFVVPLHGITSNVVLVSSYSDTTLSDDDLARHVHRRIRRRHDWQPWLQLRDLRRPVRSQLDTSPLRLEASPRLVRHSLPPAQDRRHTHQWEPIDISIMQLMRQGIRRKKIAADLKISTATIDRRLARIRDRLGVSNNATIAEAAIWQGLLDPTS